MGNSFFTVKIPDIAVSEDGKVFLPNMSNGEGAQKLQNVQGRKLKLGRIPVALTCAIHSKYILPDPTSEEESILNTTLTIVSDFSGKLISFYKPGGEILATTSTIQVKYVSFNLCTLILSHLKILALYACCLV